MSGFRQVLQWGVAVAAATVCAAVAPGASAATLHFKRCPPKAGVDHRTRCARISVPLDYSNPQGRHISLMVAIEAAAGSPSQHQGVLFVNPGGPGVPALWLASDTWDYFPRALQKAYEVVAVDPRGVGYSTAIHCKLRHLYKPPLPDLNPPNRAAERRQVRRARATARACARRYSKTFLRHMDTADMARDMDFVRAALHKRQINYLGYSYGTYLGEVYGQLFPHRVRRMMLDSTVDPTTTGYRSDLQQDRAFQVRLEDFFSWTARRNRRYRLGSSRAAVRRSYYRIRRRLAHHPLGGKVGPSELDEATANAMYWTGYWPGIAYAISAYRRGHDRALLQKGHVLSEGSSAPTLAVMCRDTPWPRRWARWDRDTRRAVRFAPFLAWQNTWDSAPCAFWPVPGQPAMKITGQGVPPVLMLQSRHDPATPVAGALHVRRIYGDGSRIVLEAGGNHGQFQAGNPCMNRYGDNYLLRGTLPAHNATCPALARYDSARAAVLAPPG